MILTCWIAEKEMHITSRSPVELEPTRMSPNSQANCYVHTAKCFAHIFKYGFQYGHNESIQQFICYG